MSRLCRLFGSRRRGMGYKAKHYEKFYGADSKSKQGI
jgi:hypothetical protein